MASEAHAIDPSRRAALLDTKLRALVREHIGREVARVGPTPPASFGGGAALVDDGVAWVLLDNASDRGLGGALAWTSRQPDATRLALLTEGSSGVLARRAALFAAPVSVLHVVGRVLVEALPDPYPPPAAILPEHDALRPLIIDAGADPVTEHGVLAGEVRGLEVCRVVTDPHTNEVRLEVGVGAHDRETFLLLHGSQPTVEALRSVVAIVAERRRLGADPHPLNRFGAERFLRWRALTEPALIGAVSLCAAAPPVPRTNIKDPVPCVAVGEGHHGNALAAVFSTGIDLELVPFAIDARAMHNPLADLVIVVPARDASPITAAVAAMARNPPNLVGL